MKVLITGSSGNLGRIITRHLIASGISVTGIDMNEAPDAMSNQFFNFYKCSITNKPLMQDIFRKEQPTHVIHLACTFNRVRNRKKEFEIDVGGSLNVLKVANDTYSVKQLIHSSSAAVYGGSPDNELWLSENQKIRPGKYRYGIIKKSIEESFLHANVRDSLKIICLRICTVIGPSFNKKKSSVSILINSKYVLKQWKENKIQFLHEEDLNALITLILKDDQINGIFNLAPNSYSTVNELIPNKKYMDLPIPFIKGFLWICWNLRILNLRPACIEHSLYPIILDPTKLISRYKYKFMFSTIEAFEETLKHFLKGKS